ncbi:Sulfurtransferase FdhD [Andreprevotia sp. IGB-42]|uniref:formate dehydrogenase accessory sulfurtransferase FdhD n=1 Tax=Andreprevotia sp. IGB-42 TaxID=2497473 RepID=UPI00157F4B2E|nr:formate dehydrogenase accessory sulfurtransferase FdhD [Andreprevotia sp. IGB-42]KAF0814907.1 Sulfurtransferase FdhD [Andreprevotia sp. IGB-42]
MDDTLIAIMALLCEEDGLSDHRIGKQLQLGMSQLNRALAVLASSAEAGGLGWLTTRDDGKRRTLWLTDAGRQQCAAAPQPQTGAQQLPALRIERGMATPLDECVAEETAVALVYNGIAHAVMMASPQDLADFALGFSLTEGIIAGPAELLDLDISAGADGVTVDMRILEQRFHILKDVRRSLAGRTGCGLCGHESLASAIRPVARVDNPFATPAADVSVAIAQLASLQPLNALTGATHAAGWWQGGTLTVREDVGRHNALDKLVGAIARDTRRDGVLVMTSRASYEIVHKAAAANIGIVAAISAPTALAVQLAGEAGITLIGFARGERITVYSHPQRIVCESG